MLGTGAGVGGRTCAAAPSKRLPTSSRIAVEAGAAVAAGAGAGLASGGGSGGRAGAGGEVFRVSMAGCFWSKASASSRRRTRCSRDSVSARTARGVAIGVSLVLSWGGTGVSLVAVADSACGGGGPPSSAKRASAVSSSPLAKDGDGSWTEIASGDESGGEGVGSIVACVGDTDPFLRAIRSVLLLRLFTLALTPSPWEPIFV